MLINYDFVDHDRIYAAGYSNGGYMTYRLSCDLSNRITAFGSVAGNMYLIDLIVPIKVVISPSSIFMVLEIHSIHIIQEDMVFLEMISLGINILLSENQLISGANITNII